MAGKFNFTTKLGLDSAGFKQGVNKVRNSINSLKASFLSLTSALGAGLGFTQLIASIKNTATDLSVAMNTLKNVSYQTKAFKDGTKEVTIEVTNFQDNLSFVRKLAGEYGQDLVAVTDNYAKFTAACKKTNLTLDDQRNVFEALTRAAAYYHLSADRTADMMNAITQMMSKGKVAAEELRRQLGNTLPGAFNLMAAALGVSTAKLDIMMRDGDVIAADVLPRFAAMLNTVTKSGDFDSLQASLNKFKNAWYQFVERSGAENAFKWIVDGSTNALGAVTNNITGIKAAFVGLFTYLASINLFSVFEKQGKSWKENLEKTLKAAEFSMARTKRAIDGNTTNLTQSPIGVYSPVSGATLTDRDVQWISQYNRDLLKAKEIQLKLGTITRAEFNAIEKEINDVTAALTGVNTATNGATVSTNRLGTAWSGVKAAAGKAAASIKAFFAANWVFMLISALTSAVSYLLQIKKEAKEIAAISDEYANKVNIVEGTTDEEAAKLRNNLEIVKNLSASESSRILALKEINKQMGLVGNKAFTLASSYAKIAEEVERWIEATKKQAIIQAHANTIADATAKRKDAERRKEEVVTELANKGALNNDLWMGIGVSNKRRELANINKEIKQYDIAIADAEAGMKELGVSLGEFYDVLNPNTDNESLDLLTELFDKYEQDEKSLANQLKENAITEEEFNKEFDKLVQEYWKKAAGIGALSIEEITKKLKNGTTLSKLEEWYDELAKDAAIAARNTLVKNFRDEVLKDLDKEIEKATKEVNDVFEKELEKSFENEKKKLHLDIDVSLGDYDIPVKKDRKTALDYSKDNSDILNEEFGLSEDWYKDIEKNYSKLIEDSSKLGEQTDAVKAKLKELAEYYKYAAKEASTLEAAMNYTKIVEDIEKVEKELNGLIYSGVKDFATSLDRVVSAWDTLEKTMSDSNSSGWEKFMAVFNMLTQVIDSALGIYQTITTIQELSAKLGAARIAEQTALNALLKEELALRMAAKGASSEEIAERLSGIGALLAEKGVLAGILGLKKQEGVQTATNTALKSGEAAASTASASASAGEAVAGATASGAKMPFPYNLIAIATGVAAVIAALTSMKKFANGGLIGGSSTHGDRVMARVNSGEMILNKAQQGTLYRAIASGNLGGGGGGEWRVRGTDLIKVIDNTKKMISK